MTAGRVGVGIVGCGLIGQKRSKALAPAKLVACADLDFPKAQALADGTEGAVALADWREVLRRDDVDAVVVSTTNDSLAEVTAAAVEMGKHVLVEKPAARNTRELARVIELADKRASLVRVGFSLRYHPALRKARDLHQSGALGEMMFVRGRYGHGGRPGYDREWRADPRRSGGGELIDQGVHLIDLARCFLGEIDVVQGFASTYYWDMPVDDNGFMMLRTASQKVAFLHVSCTEWKNLFSLEIYGRQAKIHIEGLGGSYGTEKLAYYRMLPQMGPPETTIWEYPMGDDSWSVEFAEFIDDINLRRRPAASLSDALAALKVVETICSEAGYDYHS